MDPAADSAGEVVLPELTTTVLPSNGQVCRDRDKEQGRERYLRAASQQQVRIDVSKVERVAVEGTMLYAALLRVHVTLVGLHER